MSEILTGNEWIPYGYDTQVKDLKCCDCYEPATLVTQFKTKAFWAQCADCKVESVGMTHDAERMERGY